MKSIAHCNFVTGENGVTVTDADLNSIELRIVLTDELAQTLKSGTLCLNKKDQFENISTVKVFSYMETNEINADLTELDNNYEIGTTQYYITTDIAWDGDITGREVVHYEPFDGMIGEFQFKYYKVSDAKISDENINGKIFEVTNPNEGAKQDMTVQGTMGYDGINGFFIFYDNTFPLILVVDEPSEAYPVSAGTYFATVSINNAVGMYVSKYYVDNANGSKTINFNTTETLNPVSDNIYVDYINDVFEVKKAVVSGGKALEAYPVGSIYMSVNDVNPRVLFGGVWESIAKGRTLVGIDENDTDFNEAEKTGGSKYMQEHNHLLDIAAGSGGPVPAGYAAWLASYGSYPVNGLDHQTTGEFQNWGIQKSGTGDSGNLQPYFTCYIWKRTA